MADAAGEMIPRGREGGLCSGRVCDGVVGLLGRGGEFEAAGDVEEVDDAVVV